MTMESVHIDDSALARDASGLFSVLEHLFPVSFQVKGPGGDALLGRICSAVVADAPDGLPVEWPTLILPATTRNSGDASMVCTSIQFADDPRVPWPYRGRLIAVRAELDASALATVRSPRDRILAANGEGRPIWTLGDHHGARVYRTSLRLPHTPMGDDVGLAAGAERFIQVLPLFHFLREVAGPKGLANPPLRAAFIIDDPNLHWPSYGYATIVPSRRAHAATATTSPLRPSHSTRGGSTGRPRRSSGPTPMDSPCSSTATTTQGRSWHRTTRSTPLGRCCNRRPPASGNSRQSPAWPSPE